VSPAQFEYNLRRLDEISREHGIHLLLIDYPLRPADWGEFSTDPIIAAMAGAESLAQVRADHEAYQAIVREVAGERQIPLLSTAAEFARPDPPLFSTIDPVHPNARGIEALADAVLNELIRRRWL